jgi:hypothetical protein
MLILPLSGKCFLSLILGTSAETLGRHGKLDYMFEKQPLEVEAGVVQMCDRPSPNNGDVMLVTPNFSKRILNGCTKSCTTRAL